MTAILPLQQGGAVLANARLDWVFGPVFTSPEAAAEFLAWLPRDPQDLIFEAILAGKQPDIVLEGRYRTWLEHHDAASREQSVHA